MTPSSSSSSCPSACSRPWLWAWLAGFGLFAIVAHGNFETTDATFTAQAARGLWERGDSGLRREDQGATLPGEQLGALYIQNVSCGKIGTNGLAYPWFPVGHVWLLVPFVAIGDALEGAVPAVAATFRERVAVGAADGGMTSVVQGTPLVTQGLISLLLPPACAATTLLLLFLLARQLGGSGRSAMHVALAIVLTTQAFAFGRETLSDGPGLVCLLAALLAVVAVHQGRGRGLVALAGGLAGGAAVLLRYQNAALLVAIGAALGLACWRQRRWRAFVAFTAGVVPAAILLLSVNHARFGSPFDTGYPKVDAWLDQPLWLGVTKILFAAGRGVAWFSPLVWLAVPFALRARSAGSLRWLGWALFLFPLAFFALARGWQGGQCWAARYVTHGLVALLVLTLPTSQPWRRWPRAWATLLVLGVIVNVTSLVAPVRGVLQLAAQAYAAGGGTVDAADPTGWQLRYTPLLANWRYAAASRVGGFEDERGAPRNGSVSTIEAVFGVPARTAGQGLAPQRWEDRVGRHLWWRLWGDLLGVPGWLLVAPFVLLFLVGVCGWRALRALPELPAPGPSSSSATSA